MAFRPCVSRGTEGRVLQMINHQNGRVLLFRLLSAVPRICEQLSCGSLPFLGDLFLFLRMGNSANTREGFRLTYCF